MGHMTKRQTEKPCITLIGMAGAGKSTVGRELAKLLKWAHVDTDDLIEAHYGKPLQEISDSLGRDQFVEVEEAIVAALMANRCIVSTGGSVIYGPRAVAHLQELGPVIYLEPGFEAIDQRVGHAVGRGLAIAEGQTLLDLYNERKPLYEAAAAFTVDTHNLSPQQAASAIADWLTAQGIEA